MRRVLLVLCLAIGLPAVAQDTDPPTPDDNPFPGDVPEEDVHVPVPSDDPAAAASTGPEALTLDDVDRTARTGRLLTWTGVALLGASGVVTGSAFATEDRTRTQMLLVGGTGLFLGDVLVLSGITTEALALKRTLGAHRVWPGQVGMGIAALGAVGGAVVLAVQQDDDGAFPTLEVALGVGGGAFAVGTGFAIAQGVLNARRVRALDTHTRQLLYAPRHQLVVTVVPTFDGQRGGVAVAGIW
ncbi:MAG: hypothetical protein H6733_04990 [Alphaproteobacteria bacterium]|nr:hypothetical protein [Alphaproteobacteria bacterium]